MSRIVKVYGNVVLLVSSLMVGTVLVELGCRLVGYTTQVRAFPTTLHPQFYHRADPANGYDINEKFAGGPFEFAEYIHNYDTHFQVTSNNVGCRDRVFEGEDDGFVLLIGDSHTWGYVPLEQTWGTTLEEVLGVRVLKCGVAGYGSRQERHKLEAVVAKAGRPRLVIVGYCVGNDLIDDYLYPSRTVIDGYLLTKVKLEDAKHGLRKVYSDDELRARLKSVLEKRSKSVSEQQSNGLVGRTKDFLADHSVLYDLLRKSEVVRRMAAGTGMADPLPVVGGLEVFHSPATLPWLDGAWDEHLANLQQLKRDAASIGASLFVVLIPNSYQVYEFLRPQNDRLDWEYPTKKLGDFFQHEGIPYVDLAPKLKRYARRDGRPLLDARQDLYWQYDGHMNVKGNLLTGLLIAQQVIQLSFLELQDKGRRVSEVEQRLSTLRVMTR